jgi:uncharacterized protein (UPF0147 family)
MPTFTPEMIDAVVIQLRTALLNNDKVPENVQESGKKFLEDLDNWSEGLKNETK